jgi:hypothetical protein
MKKPIEIYGCLILEDNTEVNFDGEAKTISCRAISFDPDNLGEEAGLCVVFDDGSSEVLTDLGKINNLFLV